MNSTPDVVSFNATMSACGKGILGSPITNRHELTLRNSRGK